MQRQLSWKDVREIFKSVSTEKNIRELPEILRMVDWRGLEVLEISRYGDARIPIAFNGLIDKATIVVPNSELVAEVEKNAKSAGLSYGADKKLSAITYDFLSNRVPPKLKEKGRPRQFDLVFGEWLSHSLLENPNFPEFLISHSKEYILLVMPSPKSDDSKLAEIANSGEIKRRERCRKKLSLFFVSKKYSIRISEHPLYLHFPDRQTAIELYSKVLFNNQPTQEQQSALKRYLTSKRTRNFDDSFYILFAEKLSNSQI
jgi:hypothetical protein